MVDTVLKTKGQDTRQRCFHGLCGLILATERKLGRYEADETSATIILEVRIEGGVISARESEKREVRSIEGAIAPADLLPQILDRIERMLLPECFAEITIEIVSNKGALSAVETETRKHRWDAPTRN